MKAFGGGRPTVVYLTPQPPYPLTSGTAIRNFNQLRAYGRWGNVHLVFFYHDEKQLRDLTPLERYCESLHPVANRFLERRFERAIGWRPLLVKSGTSEEARRITESLAITADLVHVARLQMVPQVEALLGRAEMRAPLILDLDDVETSTYLRRWRLTEFASLGSRAFRYYDVLRLWRYQRWAIKRFDGVLVCSEKDRQRFAAPNVFVVPNGLDVTASRPPVVADGRTLLFCGVLSYAPNADGIEYFVRTTLPLVRRQMPGVRLVVVGRTPPPKVKALHDGDSVVVEADVPSIRDYYQNATVAIVPIRFGGGTRLKILEAWSLGVPVVSTSVGCEGLDGVHEEHLLVADDPERFAQACVDLLRSPSRREELAARGWTLADRQYRWEATAERAVDVARNLLGKRKPVHVGSH
jgi:polysaccharide biosynthesis protein PslH